MDQFELAVEQLFSDQQRKFRKICDKEIAKYGGVSQKDYDDFYSRAGYEIALAKELYDPSKGGSLGNYISQVIRRAVRKEMRDHNRKRRQFITEKEEKAEKNKAGRPVRKRTYVLEIPIDAPMEDESGRTVGEALQSDFCMEDMVILENEKNDRLRKYFASLSNIQRRILIMKMEGARSSEIKRVLSISDIQYRAHDRELRAFAKVRYLFEGNEYTDGEEVGTNMSTATQTMENCKTDRISIASMIKKIDKHTIRFDHPLQRESEQWSPTMKSNLVSDILQGNKLHPLVFAEQIINGVPIIWDLDGKQRCTNAYSFFKNGYKISRNIRRFKVSYQTTEKDKYGNDILDSDGIPSVINAECDIRGKKFSDLPEELQDRFLDYSFNYDQYLNCSDSDIGYHIERYNDGKPMTFSQKGIAKLGAAHAELVKHVSNMSFFKNIGGYKISDFKNGTIDRVVVESIMAVNYLEKWNRLEHMCKYLREHADGVVFHEFEALVGRLERVVTKEVSVLFNSRDSFLWFGLFARFVELETDDGRFVKFMDEFNHSLHGKPIDGLSYDDILAQSKATKDKSVVRKKLNHLEQLMWEYLNIPDVKLEAKSY